MFFAALLSFRLNRLGFGVDADSNLARFGGSDTVLRHQSVLPLDVHPEWGNNICLARALGLDAPQPFLEWKGSYLGLQGEWNGTRDELRQRLAATVGGPVHVCAGGRDRIRRIGLVTGGAGSEVAAAAAAGLDAFISGEGPHWSFPLAEELGLNVLLAGHYATETFGVKALAAELSRRFGVPWSFIDRPTGL
ncbi:MAG: Nif3-like dinuclear metal center hexameric protein [Akkermansiaceae bacterium]|nr:Nif3-like dinuclear metal center hexameric protein [Akkermansiaceae bacterium]